VGRFVAALLVVFFGVVAFAIPAAARAGTPAAEIRDSAGRLVGEASVGPYTSPDDYGYLLTIGTSQRNAAGLSMSDISILGGKIRIAGMAVPDSGTTGAAIHGLEVNGFNVPATPNTVVQVGGGSYAVVLQEATLPGRLKQDIGMVGLRVVTGDRQILVGVTRAEKPLAAHSPSPFALLGLAPLSAVGGRSAFFDPLLPVYNAFLTPATDTIGERAVAIAERYLGVPYVWGGATPYGFDCSGLMMYVYAQLGIHLTHFSGAQFSEGTPVAVADLEPGDLVFFEPGPRGPGHVGMYVGGGDFIQAPHTGDVVKISSLYEASYSASFVGAVRPG
jgi:cell wall-associated NlpC family hydrolase